MQYIHVIFKNAGLFPQLDDIYYEKAVKTGEPVKGLYFRTDDGQYVKCEKNNTAQEGISYYFKGKNSIPKYPVFPSYAGEENFSQKENYGAPNWMNPVTTNIVANVLRALAGDIPVPTLKKSFIAKNPVFEELASKAFVKYDSIIQNDNGFPVTESFQSNKSHLKNAHSKISQTFTLYDDSQRKVSGVYDWFSFDRTFKGEDNAVILDFFKRELNLDTNPRQIPFKDIVKSLSALWNDDGFKARASQLLKSVKILDPWTYLLFNKRMDKKGEKNDDGSAVGSNGSSKGKTPLLCSKGFSSIMYISGSFYCPVTDELLAFISNGTGTATILDGGFAYISEKEKRDEHWLELNGYTKILSREEALSVQKSNSCE